MDDLEFQRIQIAHDEEISWKNAKERLIKRLLERKVQEKKLQLEGKVIYLSKVESALLNILEDARDLEDDLRKERDRSEIIISSIGEGLVAIDENFKAISANGTAGSILRVHVGEIIGQDVRNIFKIFQGDNPISHEDAYYSHVFEKGAPKMIALNDDFYYESFGKKIPVSFVATPLKRKKVEAAVIVFRDVSEEKKLDDSKTGFISIASHQLRTPLSIIKGYIELIKDGAYGKTTVKMVKTLDDMDASNERLVKLVDEFLDISRIEQGRTKFDFKQCDLRETISSVVAELKEKADEKCRQIIWMPPATECQANVDEEKIRNVVFNYIDNALKYSDCGEVKVFLESENDGWNVRVRDNGLGFGKTDEASFFQKFYRGENVKGTNVNGTGLGLYVCRKFIEAHNGRVWAKSDGLGKGSEFGFWIPFAFSPKT